jgi:hypothetical protein
MSEDDVPPDGTDDNAVSQWAVRENACSEGLDRISDLQRQICALQASR